MEIRAQDIVLNDFADMWFENTVGIRYRAFKGARDTGKSFNINGIEPFFKILADKRRNIMMVRQNDKDNAQSTYTQLKSIAKRLGIYNLFKFTKSPLMITRKATGQVILFAGMNDVQNITSTTVESGYWTDIYFEEASQLKSFEDFMVVDGSLRVPNNEPDLWCQITFCFNAWDVGHWLCDTFFKDYLEDDVQKLENERYQFAIFPEFNLGYGFGLALHTSSFRCNTYRNASKDESMKIMKEKMYDYYKVVGLGCWGNTTDKTYDYWSDNLIQSVIQINGTKFCGISIGVDFGMSNGEGKIKYSEENAKRLGSANVAELVGIKSWDAIVPIDEYFDSNDVRDEMHKKTSVQIVHEMAAKFKEWIEQYQLYTENIPCFVDCADSGGFIDMLTLATREAGISNIKFMPSSKIKILSRVYFENILMAYGCLTPSEKCVNLIREIKNARKALDGRVREDYDDHAINAFEYAWIPFRHRLRRWKSFKEPDGLSI